MNKRILGDIEETIVLKELQNQGYEVLEKNYRCRVGEIDIVAKDEGYIVFIEVKYRTTAMYGHPEFAVSKQKQTKIMKVAQNYMLKNDLNYDTPVRFDVVCVLGSNIKIIKNAFGGI